MPDAATKRICDILRRDSVLVARDAAGLFAQRVRFANQLGQDTAGRSDNRVGDGPDEAEAIVNDGMLRLAGVVALGLQVEEPRLVAEELQWLELTICRRQGKVSAASYADILSESFLGACRKSLNLDDFALVDGLFAEAREALATLEPLLTDSATSPHFEGTRTQDN